MDTTLENLNFEELQEINGGAIPAVVVGVALIGGAFVAGVVIGVGVTWAIYELTH